MWYLMSFVAGFFVALLLVSQDDIKRSFEKKRKIRRYRKLSTGRPKKLIDIRTFRDAWRYRDYPFLINGEIACVPGNQWLWWHCNDEYKQLSTLNGDSLGYLKGDVIRSRKCYSGWFYYWGMYLADSPSALGKRVKVFAVVEVY